MAQQIAKICHAKHSRRRVLRGVRGSPRNCVRPRHSGGFLVSELTRPLIPTPPFIDNEAAIAMGKLPQFTERQKHVPSRICHLKECAADKLVELRPIPTCNELVDIDTKALAFPCFQRLKDVLIGKVCFLILFHSQSHIRVHRNGEDVGTRHGHRNAMTATHVNTHL